MPRAVITGMGCVSACGIGAGAFWAAVKSGKSAVGPTELPRWLSHKIRISAQIKPEMLNGAFTSEQIVRFDPFTRFALLAADEAVAQSGLDLAELAGPRTAIIIGSGVGGLWTQEDSWLTLYGTPQPGRIDPMAIPRAMMSAPASNVGMKYRVTGPTFAVSSACSSAAQAIGIGLTMVRSGTVDRAIVGGTDCTIAPAVTRAWEAMRVLTPDRCRPFSLGRNGMVLGEGAGIFVVETPQAARARGGVPLAELLGYGTSSDATDIIRPDPAGAAQAMRLAIADAGIEPKHVDYINAHGTGTVLNDISESAAIRLAFQAVADQVSLSSTKPIHGHALGASGALELIVAVMAVRDGCAPPTVNWVERDPKCDLDVVANDARPMNIDVALSNSFAFGGINASLIVGKAA